MGDLVLRDRKCLDYVIQTLSLVAEVFAHHVFYYILCLLNKHLDVCPKNSEISKINQNTKTFVIL